MSDPALSNRVGAALREIMRSLFPRLFAAPVVGHYGQYKYRITSQSGAFVSVEPTDPDLGLPTLARLPFHGASGVAGQHAKGTLVVVAFVNGEADEAYIAAVEGADGSGFLPTTLRLDASSEVDVGQSAGAVNVGGADSYSIRHIDKIQLVGTYTDGNSLATAALAGNLQIHLAPDVLTFGAGAPPTGRSRAKT